MAKKTTKAFWGKINWKKIKIGRILTFLIYFIVIIFAITALMSKLSIGGVKLLTVQSGSMEPAIKVGAMVVVKSEKNYNVGDVVTYKEQNDATKTITHRIIKKGYTGIDRYVTKGDANDAVDPSVVLSTQILGKVIFAVPYIGYPIAFARTPVGLIVLVIFPATIIVYEEVMNVKKEIDAHLAKRKKNKSSDSEKKKWFSFEGLKNIWQTKILQTKKDQNEESD